MNSLTVLQYVTSIAVIVIAIFIIAVSVSILFLVNEIRRTLHAMRQTAEGIQKIRDRMQSDIWGSVISFGMNLFQKKPRHE